jgi:SAM-dependent methyltransferase
MELLLGCGNNRDKKVSIPDIPQDWSGDLITLDWDDACRPDVLHNLNMLPYPFDDNMFDEVHAYDTLEHCGTQGDFRFFFDQFSEIHRILKPGGYLIGLCPNWDSPWAWGDPGHTRLISKESLAFLSQASYEDQVGKTAMTDYRSCYQADFEPVTLSEQEHSWAFIMRAIKDGYKPKSD